MRVVQKRTCMWMSVIYILRSIYGSGMSGDSNRCVGCDMCEESNGNSCGKTSAREACETCETCRMPEGATEEDSPPGARDEAPQPPEPDEDIRRLLSARARTAEE